MYSRGCTSPAHLANPAFWAGMAVAAGVTPSFGRLAVDLVSHAIPQSLVPGQGPSSARFTLQLSPESGAGACFLRSGRRRRRTNGWPEKLPLPPVHQNSDTHWRGGQHLSRLIGSFRFCPKIEAGSVSVVAAARAAIHKRFRHAGFGRLALESRSLPRC
jgi:hypothetical protein